MINYSATNDFNDEILLKIDTLNDEIASVKKNTNNNFEELNKNNKFIIKEAVKNYVDSQDEALYLANQRPGQAMTYSEQWDHAPNINIHSTNPVRNLTEMHDGPYHKAFLDYVKEGKILDLNFQTKEMSTESPENGGALVSPNLSRKIIQSIEMMGVFRCLASIQQIPAGSSEFIQSFSDDTEANWVGERDVRLTTRNANIGKKTIKAHEMYAQPKITAVLLRDSVIDVAVWLMTEISRAFTRLEEDAYLNGKGDKFNQPTGILTYPEGTAWEKIEHITTADAEITTDDLLALRFKLAPYYIGGLGGCIMRNASNFSYFEGASFLMHPNTLQKISGLKEKDSGRFLLQPDLTRPLSHNLMGFPIVTSNFMPDGSKSGDKAIIFANFRKGYKIVVRQTMSLLRDPFTDKPYIKFYVVQRVGGDVVDFEAIKILKIGGSGAAAKTETERSQPEGKGDLGTRKLK